MSLPIPEQFHDLLTRPLLCAFTTLNPDGQPHTVPVWCDYDGTHIRLNAPFTTKKARNLKKNPKLSLLIIDPDDSGHWLEVQGYVGETRDEAQGARDHINSLAGKYTGTPVYREYNPTPIAREMYLVEAVKINGH